MNKGILVSVFSILWTFPLLHGNEDVLADLIELNKLMKDLQAVYESEYLRSILNKSSKKELDESLQALEARIRFAQSPIEGHPATNEEPVWTEYYDDYHRSMLLATISRNQLGELYFVFNLSLESVFSREDEWTEEERKLIEGLSVLWRRTHEYYFDLIHDPEFREKYGRTRDLYHDKRVETLSAFVREFVSAKQCSELFNHMVMENQEKFPWLYREIYIKSSYMLLEVLREPAFSESIYGESSEKIKDYLMIAADDAIMMFFRELPSLIMEGVMNKDKTIARAVFECTRGLTRPDHSYFEYDYDRFVFHFN